jgi:Icc-related predicted phosphoesterase
MKILSISDKIVQFIYSPQVRVRFPYVDLILGCGDLPYHYLEYVLNALDKPLFFVRGNHDQVVENGTAGKHSGPRGGVDLHRAVYYHDGLILAGVEGSLRYREGEFQSSQAQMWWYVLRMAPRLIWNRLFYGRYLDIFVTHAPPAGVHDQDDLPHQGIFAFLWLIKTFQPAYHFHGHVHVYKPGVPIKTRIGRTWVINTYGYCETEMDGDASPGECGDVA